MTISYGFTAVMPIAAPKKKFSFLPVLTVLFVISYGLMTMLIVVQGSALQSQRNLIKTLMRDSNELWTAKGKAISDQQMATAQAQSRSHAKTSSNQTPSTQAPSPSNQAQAQTQSNQTPSTQAQASQRHNQGRADKIAKPGTAAPPVPVDLVDRRRALQTI